MPKSADEVDGWDWRLWARRRWAALSSRRPEVALRGSGVRPPRHVAGWDARAAARTQRGERLAAAGARLSVEHDRLRAERAYGVIDLVAQERLAGQASAHRVALRRFRTTAAVATD
jgi:hypothetical protein